ncbi:hypothetical protein E1757_09910 [Paenibacillus piri]|uniref:Uncharacterized protein n=1 Tax=Paenibacillus piri TaxID=2547395 RepID=A0A4R5KSI5_9BACL|nr:hypothetical protein E1757_09910 [Paenibacillus piri]
MKRGVPLSSGGWSFSLLTAIIQIVYLVAAGFAIYGFVLFIKLARRGIRALDIYLDEKSRSK